MMIEWHYHDSGTDRAGVVDALAGLARVLAELAGVGQHGGGGGGGGAATYRDFMQTQSRYRVIKRIGYLVDTSESH